MSWEISRIRKHFHNIGQKSLSGFPALAQSKPKRQRRGIGDRSINDRLLAGKGIGRKEDIRRIQELIEQLPENQRQVIRLRGIEDCSYEDIEQITGLSSSNIRTLLSRARKLIREKLEKASCHG